MDSETQPTAPSPVLTESQPILQPPSADKPQLIAPVWHTILILVIVLANSFFTASSFATHRGEASTAGGRIGGYAFTIALEFFLLLLVWIGLRLKKHSMRELIGGKWNKPEDFLLDVGIALGFWVIAILILAGLAYLLGQVNQASVNDMKQRLAGVIPRSGREVTIFVSLSVIAGLVEEILFRGYLQKQIGAMARNAYIGVVFSAVIFGLGHGYQGTKNMIRIAVFGALFGLLALWRKSLRPGMMAHAWQDTLAGVGSYILSQKGKF